MAESAELTLVCIVVQKGFNLFRHQFYRPQSPFEVRFKWVSNLELGNCFK